MRNTRKSKAIASLTPKLKRKLLDEYEDHQTEPVDVDSNDEQQSTIKCSCEIEGSDSKRQKKGFMIVSKN